MNKKETQMNFDLIENKYKTLIDIAKEKMLHSQDYEHNFEHIKDVVCYVKKLLSILKVNADAEVCILAAYWHDIGRLKTANNHEKISAEMLKKELKKQKFEKSFIDNCYAAIENHKYNMTPLTIEGKILKDADKLAWLGIRRWKSCLKNGQKLDSIINLLPKLRNEILFFDESKKFYDKEIVKLTQFLYKTISNFAL